MAEYDDFFVEEEAPAKAGRPDPSSFYDKHFVEDAPEPQVELTAMPVSRAQPDFSEPSTPKYDPTPSKKESAAGGLMQGLTAGWGDELSALGDAAHDAGARMGILPKIFEKKPTAAQQAVDEDLGEEAGFGQVYERALAAKRARRDWQSEENPKTFAGADFAGNMVTSAVVPGGLLGGAAMGALGGAGYSDDNKLAGAALGGVIGGTLGKAAQKAPAITGLVGAGLGAAGALDSGAKESDRWSAGISAGTALAGAVTAGAGKLAGKTAKYLKGKELRARGEVGEKLIAEDVTDALSYDKRRTSALESQKDELAAARKWIDKEQAAALGRREGLDDAYAKFGKDKLSSIIDAAEAKRKGRGDEDKAVSKAFSEQQKKQQLEDAALVDAYMRGESAPGGPQASEARVAEFEAAIPAKVQGKQDADFQAVLNRFLTMKQLGEPIPPEIDARVQALKERYAGNSPEFFKRFLYDWENSGPKYENELRAQAADMRGQSSAAVGRDTDVKVPEVVRADTAVSGRPEMPSIPKEPIGAELGDEEYWTRFKIAKEQGVPYKEAPEYRSGYTATYENRVQQHEAQNRALNRIIGLEEAGPGYEPDFGALVNERERAEIRQNRGVPEQEYAERPSESKALRNYPEIRDWYVGPPEPGSPGRDTATNPMGFADGELPPTAPSPGRKTPPRPAPTEPRSAEFYSAPAPDPDFRDSPIDNETWNRLAKNTPDEQLTPLGGLKGFTDGTLEPLPESPTFVPPEPPSMDSRIDAELQSPATDAKLAQARALGAARGARNPFALVGGASLGGVGGLAAGSAIGVLNGVATQYVTLANRDPAVRARLLGAVERVFRKVPELHQKIAPFLGAGLQRGTTELVKRIQQAAETNKEFARMLNEEVNFEVAADEREE